MANAIDSSIFDSGEGVSQDSGKMMGIADEIVNDATSLANLIEEMYNSIHKKIVPEISGKDPKEVAEVVWYGERAGIFANNQDEVREKVFDPAVETIKEFGKNFHQQAESWEAFERRG